MTEKVLTDIGVDELLQLPGKVLVLMPSDAAARQCRDAIARSRGQHDQAFLETVTVVPLDQWLASLWDDCFAERQVLRPVQVLALARGIIENSEHYPPDCLNPLAITRQFVDAFQLHSAYQLPPRREDYLFNAEYQAFFQWRSDLQAALDQQQALTSQQLPGYLLAEDNLTLPNHIVLSPCLSLNPASQALLDHWAQRCQRWQLARAQRHSTPALVAAMQQRQECEAVANWLATTLPQRDSSATLCIAVPDMARYQFELHGALARHLYPRSVFPHWPTADGTAAEQPIREPWLFENSEKILSFPLISAAWDIISLTSGPMETEKLSRILRSRFLGGWPGLRSRRAQLDLHWRERLGPESSLAGALTISAVFSQTDPDIIEPLQAVAGLLGGAPQRQLPSQWVRHFDQMLLISGWPNAEDNDLVVAQCRRGFSQAMDVFRALDRQLGPVSQGDALSWLQHILSSKRFSIARDWASPVRIMAYEDAVGREFDAIWIMGLDDNTLPRRAEPSPFLPLHLQQAAGIPGSSADICLTAGQALLAALVDTAPEVYVSHCQQDDNGSPLSPSSLLLGATPVLLEDTTPGYHCSAKLTKPQSDGVTPVSVQERERLRGGTSLFKEFATSPLLAFLKFRLHLREFPRPTEGLDQRVQGILVHDTLQYFWQQTRDSQGLAALSDNQLSERVQACVAQAMTHPELRGSRYGSALKALEARRLTTLVCAWLQKERTRLEDFSVVATEQLREYRFMGIPLQLRIDRIDQVGPHRLVIDYKTGRVEGRDLNVDQLNEPQLPIYALAEIEAGAPVDGVMLAQVKSVEELNIHMRSNWANSVVNKSPREGDVDSPQKWQDELRAWENVLAEMAQGILGGDISHDFGSDHRRGFSAYLLPLLRGEGGTGDEPGGEVRP